MGQGCSVECGLEDDNAFGAACHELDRSEAAGAHPAAPSRPPKAAPAAGYPTADLPVSAQQGGHGRHSKLQRSRHEENATILAAGLGSLAVLRQKGNLKHKPTPWGGLEVPASAYAACPEKSSDHWGRWYRASRELGRGVSASVVGADALARSAASAERETLMPGVLALRKGEALCGDMIVCSRGVALTSPLCDTATRHRQVAIKRFKKLGTRSFHTELAALLRIGVHPHVLRLLESYEACDGEDVLILEYCDGATVFDAYAAAVRDGKQLPERFAARIVRQTLLALEFIHACGIEHQDIKPENLLLYNYRPEEYKADVKLGDFGWAVPAPKNGREYRAADSVPPDGAGSLWYAPAELNPPVSALGGKDGLQYQKNRERFTGRSDMWSLGVILYVLLVGHNPFHLAGRSGGSTRAVESEVMRLVALGQFDQEAPGWKKLAVDARELVSAMMQPVASERLTTASALRHPFLVRCQAADLRPHPVTKAWQLSRKEDVWSRLDGFQRLAWAAVARAVTEPELREDCIDAAMSAMRSTARTSTCAVQMTYLLQLARELCCWMPSYWLKTRAAWADIARLAFRYLDVDADGMLAPRDLVRHLVPEGTDAAKSGDEWSAAHAWVARWGSGAVSAASSDQYCSSGLSPRDFLNALLETSTSRTEDCDPEGTSLEEGGEAFGASTKEGEFGALWVEPRELGEWCGARD
eukprot:TRINITY_DN36077_c0_g1_i1.p1 TRINITY_DN36077_c0_g1~~TRINITY_DN36077_c0_g1_i1.p1  ORF type:complete len:724 (-),score=138.53 TRINITY_DN36077_c0_g1_i1:184-2283(-)